MEKESKGMQENIVLLQLLEKHLEELKQQGALLENKFIELETTKQITEDMKKMKDSQDVMIPLGSGIYSYGKITDTEKVMVELGAGVVLNKTLSEATRFIEEKEKEIEKLSNQLNQEMTEVVEKINQIVSEIQKAQKESGSVVES